MADVDSVFQIEMRRYRRKVVCIVMSSSRGKKLSRRACRYRSRHVEAVALAVAGRVAPIAKCRQIRRKIAQQLSAQRRS
jgi:hypothetical protein